MRWLLGAAVILNASSAFVLGRPTKRLATPTTTYGASKRVGRGLGARGGDGLDRRPAYALTGWARPRFRGQLMGALHKTGVWYALITGYLAWAFSLCGSGAAAMMPPRLAVALATSTGIFISHGYHNSDQRSGGRAPTVSGELKWLRLDYVSISCIISANMWLWGGNANWPKNSSLFGVICGACTAAVAAASYVVVPRAVGDRAVQVALGLQYLGCLLRLVAVSLEQTWSCALVYLSFLPGFVLYVARYPKNDVFGYHEYFHSSVLLGHVACVLLDARFLLGR